ncbi:hypothetical protein AX27061_0369 [Achromobacter xylosoxidans NBRC 15126 = ATCC 27061]|nr:hypothetical protein AX27061_0369 [Achromobacter xylosoxidans NBRC 15126 = ATCC 27061]
MGGEGFEFDFGHGGSRGRWVSAWDQAHNKKPGPGYWFRAWLCVLHSIGAGRRGRVQGREGNHRHPEDKRHQRHEAPSIWFWMETFIR